MSIENDLDFICLTETWLTCDITDEALFLEDYTIHKRDKKDEPHKTEHGGVLIAVRNIPHERITLNSENEYVVINVKPKDVPMLICCLYYPPKNNPYRWSSESLISLTNELNEYAATENCDYIIITGDINFENTTWEILLSNDAYEDTVLESLGKHQFKEILSQKEKTQLEIFLNNNPSTVNNHSEVNEFNRSFS